MIADQVYIGSIEVEKIYLGAIEVWGFDPFPILLTVPEAPTVSASTGVIAEDPVGDTIELTVPAVPTITVSTDVEE